MYISFGRSDALYATEAFQTKLIKPLFFYNNIQNSLFMLYYLQKHMSFHDVNSFDQSFFLYSAPICKQAATFLLSKQFALRAIVVK